MKFPRFHRGRGTCRTVGIHETAFPRIVSDRRIIAVRSKPGIRASIGNRPRNAWRRSGPNWAAGQRIARRGLQRIPFLPELAAGDPLAHSFRQGGRENTVFQIPWSLALFIERMNRHDAHLALVANEDACHRTINWTGRVHSFGEAIPWNIRGPIKYRWRIEPAAAAGIKEPAAVMVRSPAPRLRAHPSPAER